jgi:hypothetical protein
MLSGSARDAQHFHSLPRKDDRVNARQQEAGGGMTLIAIQTSAG